MSNQTAPKFCPNCGAPINPGMKFCNHCGTALNIGSQPQYQPPQPQYQAPQYQAPQYQAPQSGYQAPYRSEAAYGNVSSMTKKEFRKVCTDEKYRKSLKTNAIIMYVLAGINLVYSIAANTWGLDVAITLGLTLGLTLGMHLGKSKGCAIGILVYSIVNMIILLVGSGSLGGWLWLVVGISSLKAFSIADKQYEALTGNQ